MNMYSSQPHPVLTHQYTLGDLGTQCSREVSLMTLQFFAMQFSQQFHETMQQLGDKKIKMAI